MERIANLLVILAIVLVVVLASDVEGGRLLKGDKKENVDQPQNFLGSGGISGLFPSPGFAGVGFGPSGFCTFPGGCSGTPTLPTIPIVGGSPTTTFPTIPSVGRSPPHA